MPAADGKKDNKKDGKGDKDKETTPLLGPDGKPIPPEPLTEAQQVQLQIENQASEVNTKIYHLKDHFFK